MSTNEVNINDERSVRLKKLQDLQELNINSYPSKTSRTNALVEALNAKEGNKFVCVGRIMMKREIGKLTFIQIEDESARMQVVFKQDNLEKENYKLFVKKADVGDIIEVSGNFFVTKTGEKSILANNWKMLSKSLLPLPDKFHGLQDEETKFRKRYLDLIMNSDSKELFRRKSKFWSAIREFLVNEGFLEVETPVLETTTGGAEASPFVTHHDALDMDVYLRISMGELWQKRLMVGGFEKTFEIGRQFRNEGMSREHLQDYTQMEYYWAYKNYEDNMEMVEKMIKFVAEKTWGTLKFNLKDFGEIDLGQKWERLDYVSAIKEKLDIDVLTSSEDDLKKRLNEMGSKYENNAQKGRLIDLIWKQIRKQYKGPLFLVNHPVEVSALAKRKEDNLELTERFQIIVAGSELGNGYSELNDPIDQKERFQKQLKMREGGDEEAHMYDADFIEALEHAMPPTTGFGISERFFAFFEDKPVRDCVLFPLMKPEQE
ncbi:MAG: lysine--tRNA ligase [Candidatus Magasanikbacteria bacterium CG_4_9_14_3_um_filter_32_9]|uniref:Lysine--tRNA ligase n=1 Tax=Candidatus Magasanikbacteria bacterium CG_4_9_14_3_um_filter_32_9 TaxID=1974644 RepID=A0A2M7Z6M5_9BACT|nr:MAG: lysine--tRNA ligase [Candidatus Magasanikbacteria bacterium CG_4_9_14_3_um_filter_32_9]